jgi:hypothetical protein
MTRRQNSKQVRVTIREFCDRCPVRAQCLEEGMKEVRGIWGGTTPEERRMLRAKQAVLNIHLTASSALSTRHSEENGVHT